MRRRYIKVFSIGCFLYFITTKCSKISNVPINTGILSIPSNNIGIYGSLAQTKRFTRQPLASIVSNSKQHLLPLQSIYVSNS